METSPPTPPKSPAKPMIMRIYVWWSTLTALHLTPPEALPRGGVIISTDKKTNSDVG